MGDATMLPNPSSINISTVSSENSSFEKFYFLQIFVLKIAFFLEKFAYLRYWFRWVGFFCFYFSLHAQLWSVVRPLSYFLIHHFRPWNRSITFLGLPLTFWLDKHTFRARRNKSLILKFLKYENGNIDIWFEKSTNTGLINLKLGRRIYCLNY